MVCYSDLFGISSRVNRCTAAASLMKILGHTSGHFKKWTARFLSSGVMITKGRYVHFINGLSNF